MSSLGARATASASVTDDRPPKRRKRAHLNCAECRRLKLKCDRTVPCAHCVKRKCQELCPDGAREGTRKNDNAGEVQALQEEVRQLRQSLASQALSHGTTTDMSEDEDEEDASPEDVGGAVGPDPVPIVPGSSTHGPAVTFAPLVPPVGSSTVSLFGATNDGLGQFAEQSHGTLVLSHNGRSKYLGPSAASEWLKDQEVQDSREASPVTRPSSPTPQHHTFQSFPFAGSRLSSTAAILSKLPPHDEALLLVSSHNRYFGWSYQISPRERIERTLQEAYRQQQSIRPVIDLQALALLFVTLAMGTLYNLELAPNDPISEEYIDLARTCLAKDNFMVKNTLAGVQTINVMAHFILETDRGRNGDAAWPLWGLAMRIIQAMGLHRDGAKWNLAPDLLDERRRIFWETHSAEVFQANCFSRPCSISPEFVDTAMPTEDIGYSSLKLHLCRMAEGVLRNALLVNQAPFNNVTALYNQLTTFERSIPFAFRCRTALVALPSVYHDSALAVADSPEINRRDLRRTFEQHHLALMTSEAVVNLYRPYFMQALAERPEDPTRTQFALPFLAVVERHNAIIQIGCSLYAIYPSVTARHWWVWYHAFNAAVCMGTLLLMSPLNEFAGIALSLMDQVITIYTSLVQTRAAPRPVQNLQWLLRLRGRAVTRMDKARSGELATASRDEDPDADTSLVGWKTRFIERAAAGAQTARTISTASPAQSNRTPTNLVDSLIQSMPQAVQQHVGQEQTFEQTTDQLLQQFWDPATVPLDQGQDWQHWWNTIMAGEASDS